MADIFIMGAGGFGMALALLAHKAGNRVTLWSYSPEEAQMLRTLRSNEKLLPGVSLPDEIEITTAIADVAAADIAVIVTPSHAVRTMGGLIAPHLKSEATVVCASKGIEAGTLKLLSDVLAEELPGVPIVILSGPSHAEEVTREIPTTVVAASEDIAAAERVRQALGTSFFRIYPSGDVPGVELGGALKNIIALAAGILDGLGLGDNTKAALMTRGIAEIARLGAACGAKAATFGGLSGMGDLIVTCTSLHSRNRRAGMYIGQGLSPAQALEKVGMTVEGYTATKAAYEMSVRLNVEMPITAEVYRALYEGKAPKEAINDLMMRPGKQEFEDLWG